MAKFHINGKGEAGKCGATKGGCPFGSEDSHFATVTEAQLHYEDSREPIYSALTKAKKDEVDRVARLSSYRLSPEDNFGQIDDSPLASDSLEETIYQENSSNESTYSRADFAYFNEEEAVYGVRFEDDYVGEVFAGPQLHDESDDEYRKRKIELVGEHWNEIAKALQEEYGGELTVEGDEQSTLEFAVKYPGEDPSTVSLAMLGDMVERDTRLLDFKNATDDSRLQSLIAKKLGYEWRLTEDHDRHFGDGFWVKKED